jgi:hypothetical protein
MANLPAGRPGSGLAPIGRGALCLAAALLALLIMCWPAATARTVIGTPKSEQLTGSKRADLIKGGGGNDRLRGGRGNDRLRGGAGNDRLNGGRGKDVLDCGPGRDRAAADRNDVVRRNCETVTGRRDDDDPPPPPRPPPLSGQFDGVLTTTVRYLSVCTGQVLGEQTTQIPSRVTIGPPLQPNPADLPADTPETNPINLIVGQTNVAGTIAPGSVNIASAARFRFSPIRSLTLKYWRLALAGNQLTGTLVEDNREAGAAFNLLAAHQELLACNPNFGTYVNQLDIAEGATLTGTVTAQQVQLRITGRTFAGFHQFVAAITANRAG